MLAELGYAPVLDRDAANGAAIEPGKHYAYEAERGPVETRRQDGDSVISGRTLLDMAADDYDDARTREEARRLMRALIADRLGGQALHTRAVLSELQDL
jgi:DNA repair protein RecO (recombination protein O)